MRATFLLIAFLVSGSLLAQEAPPQEAPFVNDSDLDQEIDTANGPVLNGEEKKAEIPSPPPTPPIEEKPALVESPKAEAIRKPIIPVSPKVQSNTAEDFHPSEPQFVKPDAPTRGGILRVPHPNAAKGLLRIDKDGSYQYAIGIKPKSQSASLRLGTLTPPKITGGNSAAGTLSYDSMYGKSNLVGMTVEYEWQPFTSFGRLGLNIGTGFATARGNGFFKNVRASNADPKAEEIYTLYVIPASLFLTYRFEYARRQKIIPYINGGGTYYGMIESRDDGKSTNMAAAPAVGGGGGLMFSITAWDHAGAFALDREYGIADMYFTLEARGMAGLDKTIDFSTQSINGGITVDF